MEFLHIRWACYSRGSFAFMMESHPMHEFRLWSDWVMWCTSLEEALDGAWWALYERSPWNRRGDSRRRNWKRKSRGCCEFEKRRVIEFRNPQIDVWLPDYLGRMVTQRSTRSTEPWHEQKFKMKKRFSTSEDEQCVFVNTKAQAQSRCSDKCKPPAPVWNAAEGQPFWQFLSWSGMKSIEYWGRETDRYTKIHTNLYIASNEVQWAI